MLINTKKRHKAIITKALCFLICAVMPGLEDLFACAVCAARKPCKRASKINFSSHSPPIIRIRRIKMDKDLTVTYIFVIQAPNIRKNAE